MAEKVAQEINLQVSEERINSMDLETFYNVEGSVKATIDFVCHFAVDDKGNYLPKKDAVVVVTRGRTIGDIGEIAEKLRASMEDRTVPKV